MDSFKFTPVIGITGGAGSGKSYVAEVLSASCKVYHINTDRISEMQMAKGGSVYQKVLEYFGKDFLSPDGEINRKKLGEYIFHRPDELLVLNSITHPPVRDEVDKRIQQGKAERYDVILLETALLFEAGYEAICDEIWYVYATRDARKKRLMRSRGYTAERIQNMLKRQHTDTFFRTHADYVINNTYTDAKKLSDRLLRRLKRLQMK